MAAIGDLDTIEDLIRADPKDEEKNILATKAPSKKEPIGRSKITTGKQEDETLKKGGAGSPRKAGKNGTYV
jgi:hypothetical protein